MRPGKEILEVIAAAQTLIASQPPKSVLAVLDATGSVYNTEILSAMKRFLQANTPYVRCSVAVGVTGLLEIALLALSRAAGRSFRTFPNREAAMEYLILQDKNER